MSVVIKCKHCAHFPQETGAKMQCDKANKLVSGDDIQHDSKSGYRGFICKRFVCSG